MMTERAPRETGPVTQREAARGAVAGPGGQGRRGRGVRRWAWAGLIAQVAFVASWAAASNWQGPRYIGLLIPSSDMYALGVPARLVPIVTFTLTGAATIMFAIRSMWPALRPGGRIAAAGSALLALSVCGWGDLVTARANGWPAGRPIPLLHCASYPTAAAVSMTS